MKRGALALCAAAAFAGGGGAQAAGFPDRPVNVFVPTAAGGTVDIVARIMAEKLGPELGQPVVVINKPGAGGVVARRRSCASRRTAIPCCSRRTATS
jgi:tripartite-type tricarboxylate transporter receptor subunit TctC